MVLGAVKDRGEGSRCYSNSQVPPLPKFLDSSKHFDYLSKISGF